VEAKVDENILGALFLEPGHDPRIALNRRHSFFRRRLTCALEPGHYVRVSASTNEYERADLFDRSEERGGEADDVFARDPREAIQIRLETLGFRVPGSEAT